MPFPDHSFDIIHSRFSGLRYSPDIKHFEALIYEIDRWARWSCVMRVQCPRLIVTMDRLVRPGGWIVQDNLCLKMEDYKERIKVLLATSQVLGWKIIRFVSRATRTCEDHNIDAGFQKPLNGFNRPEKRPKLLSSSWL